MSIQTVLALCILSFTLGSLVTLVGLHLDKRNHRNHRNSPKRKRPPSPSHRLTTSIHSSSTSPTHVSLGNLSRETAKQLQVGQWAFPLNSEQ